MTICVSGFDETVVYAEIYAWNTETWDLTDGQWMGLDDHLVVEGTTQSELCGNYAGPGSRGTSNSDALEVNGYAYFSDGSWDYLVFGADESDVYADLPTVSGDQVCIVQTNNGDGGEWGCDPANGSDW